MTALSGRVEITTVARIPNVEVIAGLIVCLIISVALLAGIVAQETATTGIVIRCRLVSAAANVVNARVVREIAAAAIAAAVPRRCGMRRTAIILSKALGPHTPADAIAQHGTAHNPCYGGSRGTKKRTAASTWETAHRGTRRISGLRITCLWISSLRRGLTGVRTGAPHAA